MPIARTCAIYNSRNYIWLIAFSSNKCGIGYLQ